MNRLQCIDLFNAALSAADPYAAVKKSLVIERDGLIRVSGTLYDIERYETVIVAGAGKASAAMARAAEDVLGPELDRGIIIVKYGHTGHLRKIKQIEAAHPLPDARGAAATEEISELLRAAGEQTLVFCLFSGGASSLLVSPVEGITLRDKQDVTDALLKAGAAIDELNAVRKHLSKVKGGRLAELAFPATVVTLLLSDVLGDRLDVIASGPTVPDTTTFARSLDVLKERGVIAKTPQRVFQYLQRGASGQESETPKDGNPCFAKAKAFIVGGLEQSLIAAKLAAEDAGFDARIITERLSGEARTAARCLAQQVREVKQPSVTGRTCLISGGETTVTVKGNGTGGRNQELALAFAREIDGVPGITMLSAGTDGTDGPTDAAGAVVDGATLERARRVGIDPEFCLETNDSYRFFQMLDSRQDEKHHLMTGPTGTNVMDIQIMLIEAATVL